MTAPATGTRLSPKEEQVLLYLRTTDLSYAQIALELARGESTVKTHAKRAFRRLGVCGRVGYLRSLMEDGRKAS